jgi:hypothetical protein
MEHFSPWGQAVLRHWGLLMTGGLPMAGLALWEHRTGQPISWGLFAIWALAVVLWASYQAWRDERGANRAKAEDVRVLTEKVRRLEDRRPRLEAQIEQLIIGDNPGLEMFPVSHLEVVVRNLGGSPSIAERWRLEVRIPEGTYHGRFGLIGNPIVGNPTSTSTLGINEESHYVLTSADALYEKAESAPIVEGTLVRGWLRFNFFQIEKSQLFQSGALWILTFQDIRGTQTSTQHVMMKRSMMSEPLYLPGAGGIIVSKNPQPPHS